MIELALASVDQVVVGSDPTKLMYELNNIELENEVIRHNDLAQNTAATYQNGKMFFCDHVSIFETSRSTKPPTPL